MTKPRLILDQDDVLADTHGKLAKIVLNDFGTNLTHETLHQGPFRQTLSPEDQQRLYQLIHEPGFFADIPLIPNAREAVFELNKKYEIFVATAAMEFPNSFRDKYDWLHTHFDFIPWNNLVFCGDKSVLNGDYLIDDMPRNLKSFRGKGLLFNAPHNLDETEFERVMHWEDITKLLL
jgi:5'(3')-deoxyribonucleotidase